MQAYDAVADALSDSGYAIFDGFLKPNEVEALRQIIEDDVDQNRMKKAGIGTLNQFQVIKEIRGDYIRWIDPETAAPATRAVLDRLAELQQFLNRALYLGIRDLEIHFAKYPVGTHYDRHLDQFQVTSHRVLSVVMYLSEGWEPGDGGELMMYLPSGDQKIEPIPGRLVMFLSDSIEHEVLVTHRPRYSMTGWFLNQPVDIPFVRP